MDNIKDSSIDFALAKGKGITTMIIWEPKNTKQYRGIAKERGFRFKCREDEKSILIAQPLQPAIEEIHPTSPVSPQKNAEVKLKLVDDYILRYPGFAPMD